MLHATSFRPGIVTFGIAASCSFLAAAGSWVASSAQDFDRATNSWNCKVSSGAPTIFGSTFCLPQSLQFAILALAVSFIGLSGIALSRVLVRDWGSHDGVTPFTARFLLASVAVGAVFDWQMFVAGYGTDYRGPLIPVAMLIAAMAVAKLMFPERKLLILLVLTVALAIAGFFAGVMMAAMFGIPFD